MYGMINRFQAHPGKRDELLTVMTAEIGAMPGCLSYIVATDPKDDTVIWVTEVWDSAESHKASLTLPAVQASIAKAMPLIASFGPMTETVPVGGIGLGGA